MVLRFKFSLVSALCGALVKFCHVRSELRFFLVENWLVWVMNLIWRFQIKLISVNNENAVVISFQRHYSFRIALDSISIPVHCLHLCARISFTLIHFSSIYLDWSNCPMYTMWIIKYFSSQDVVSFQWIHDIIERNLFNWMGRMPQWNWEHTHCVHTHEKCVQILRIWTQLRVILNFWSTSSEKIELQNNSTLVYLFLFLVVWRAEFFS